MSTILVVDDTAVDRRIAGGLLEATGRLHVEYAENAEAALERLAKHEPDLVLTDMQMPGMGGLELVTQIRVRHPRVPVILMTGQGSESIAVEALERGAASYVPKAELARGLVNTVEEVLSIAHAGRSHVDLIACQQEVHLRYALENRPRLVDALVDLVQQMVAGMGITDDTGRVRMGIALREALHNALYHGNLQLTTDDLEAARDSLLLGGSGDVVASRAAQLPYSTRRIHVDIRIVPEEARFVVRDEGQGFDYASLLTQMQPETVGALESQRGRGFVLMMALMDEISFNETGNEVTLIKYRDS
jgi:CheY-like chemotaxis protein